MQHITLRQECFSLLQFYSVDSQSTFRHSSYTAEGEKSGNPAKKTERKKYITYTDGGIVMFLMVNGRILMPGRPDSVISVSVKSQIIV